MPREPVREVVAGVDGSPDATAVLDLAAAEAGSRSAHLVLAQVAAKSGTAVLPGAVTEVRAAHPTLPLHVERLRGDPATALAARATSASLLVVDGGHRRGRRAGQRRPGSLAAGVLELATVPVIICPTGGHRTDVAADAPVVVGIDGTRGSEAALRFGFVEADLRHAPLVAMHLWPPLTRPAPGCGGANAAEGAFLDLLETWSGKYPEVPVRLAVRHGLDAAIVLAAASRSARLVVVEALAGPLLAALADRAACPVAAVPDTD